MSSHAWWFSVNIHRQSWSYSLLVFCKIWVCLSTNPPPINDLCKNENLSFNVRQSSKYKVQMQKHSGIPFQTVDKCRFQSPSQNELLTSQRIGAIQLNHLPQFSNNELLELPIILKLSKSTKRFAISSSSLAYATLIKSKLGSAAWNKNCSWVIWTKQSPYLFVPIELKQAHNWTSSMDSAIIAISCFPWT